MNARYVARVIPGRGWRCWNRRTRRWWGNHFAEYPAELLAELNGEKRPERLVELSKPKRSG
jgi:hypothetical protein